MIKTAIAILILSSTIAQAETLVCWKRDELEKMFSKQGWSEIAEGDIHGPDKSPIGNLSIWGKPSGEWMVFRTGATEDFLCPLLTGSGMKNVLPPGSDT